MSIFLLHFVMVGFIYLFKDYILFEYLMFCSFLSDSNGSPSVASPFHLSWLCLVEYLGLFTAQEVNYYSNFQYHPDLVHVNVTMQNKLPTGIWFCTEKRKNVSNEYF